MENWLNPNIGDMPLDNIKNLALKNLGVTMVKGGLGASAIRAYIQVVKMVVASAVNAEGEALYPRKWNHDFIDLPVVKDQKQPIFAGDAVTGIVAAPAKNYHRVLYTLCAASGLRFGEALGIDIKNVSPDGGTIKICQKAWRGQLHDYLKTDNGGREVDLHLKVCGDAEANFIGEIGKKGSCSGSKTGKPSHNRTSLRRVIASGPGQTQSAEVWRTCLPPLPPHMAPQE